MPRLARNREVGLLTRPTEFEDLHASTPPGRRRSCWPVQGHLWPFRLFRQRFNEDASPLSQANKPDSFDRCRRADRCRQALRR